MRTLLVALRLAISAIGRNKLRGVLTVLGIMIGIMAVVTVTALAGGAKNMVAGEIEGFAANALFVNPQPVQASGVRGKAIGRLTEADGKAIAREAVSVSAVAPWLSTMGQVVYGDKNVQTLIVGTTTSYFPIRKFRIDKGELWTETDELLKTKVCVIGPTAAGNLFGSADPVGRTIRIGRSPYRIIGIFAPRGTSLFGEDQDDRILMPVGSFRARVMHTAPGRADTLMVSATSEQTTERAQKQIEQILRQRHQIGEGREDDFQVSTQKEFQQTTSGILTVLQTLLLAVATVSLFVGGVGVMNIMLVSVAERTREIGIRMSIGAREGDIRVQFLVEAVMLTLIGGLLGMIAGISLTAGLAYATGWRMAPTLESLLVAVATSAAIGIVFGFLPAHRASKLDPIEALRVE